LLLEAKANVADGEWLPWLAANCEMSARTAQAYLRLARNLGRSRTSQVEFPCFRLPTKEIKRSRLIELSSRRNFAMGARASDEGSADARRYPVVLSTVLICHIAQGNAGVHF
jgi:hypothetical protein